MYVCLYVLYVCLSGIEIDNWEVRTRSNLMYVCLYVLYVCLSGIEIDNWEVRT